VNNPQIHLGATQAPRYNPKACKTFPYSKNEFLYQSGITEIKLYHPFFVASSEK
jgi:hypothetical protein